MNYKNFIGHQVKDNKENLLGVLVDITKDGQIHWGNVDGNYEVKLNCADYVIDPNKGTDFIRLSPCA